MSRCGLDTRTGRFRYDSPRKQNCFAILGLQGSQRSKLPCVSILRASPFARNFSPPGPPFLRGDRGKGRLIDRRGAENIVRRSPARCRSACHTFGRCVGTAVRLECTGHVPPLLPPALRAKSLAALSCAPIRPSSGECAALPAIPSAGTLVQLCAWSGGSQSAAATKRPAAFYVRPAPP